MNPNRRSLTHAVALSTAVAVTALGAAVQAADWGTVKGKFVYKGQAKNEPVVVNKDVEYCGQHTPHDESIVLGEGGALRNVFVYLYPPRGKKVEIHPDYKASAEPRVLDNKFCRFEPHAMAFWNAEEFEVKNDDPGVGHNTNFQAALNTDFNLTISNDTPLKRKFDKSDPAPAKVTCNIYPWMTAYVLVRDNPYVAVTGEDGTFEIANVPAGAQEFVLWHEVSGYLKDLRVGKLKADRKGQIKVTVPAGDTVDLGVIEITPDLLGQ